MSALVIRPSTAADGQALKAVRLAALFDEPDAFGSSYAVSLGYPDSQWATMAAEWNYYLAFDDEEPVGMASGGRNDAWPSARWLYGMFVRADHRGSGVADDLVDTVARWARAEGVDTLGLHVTTSLPRAVAFYTRLGFVPSGETEPMQREPSLTLQIMTLDLKLDAPR